MGYLFPLPLFPEGSLASSVVTTVWVGVVVFSLMNLRFGWTFSGLVVPGYLVPLLMVKPWAVAVIVGQAMLALWIVQGWCSLMPRLKIGCAFFGRDRFFALILVSIALRLVGDVWLLPELAAWLEARSDIRFDYRTNLHSFGLIIICLTANQFWKTGVLRGALPFLFNLLVTWLVVRWVLMEFTNFSITNLAFLYEDIASNIEASPKAYIVMITTSIIASRMNLLYGWDFNGIMIPALLAVQWYEPLKIAASVVEAVVILEASKALMRTPLLRNLTMEGARKMLLFFTVSFAYKLLLGHGISWVHADVKVSDYYGFGYLLPTLMAMKMHQLNSVVKQVRITVEVSLISIAVANAAGFALTLLPERVREAGQLLEGGETFRLETVAGGVDAVLEDCVDALHGSLLLADHEPPPMRDLIHVERGVGWLLDYRPDGSRRALHKGVHLLREAGLETRSVGGRYLLCASTLPGDGRGCFVIDTRSESDLAVQCPYPLDEAGSFAAAKWLFQTTGARLLVVAGSSRELGRLEEADVRLHPSSVFHHVHLAASDHEVVQVRVGPDHRLHVRGQVPAGLTLRDLEAGAGAFELVWEVSPGRNVQRGTAQGAFGEWFVSPSALERLLTVNASPAGVRQDPFDFRSLPPSAEEGSGMLRPFPAGELLRFERSVVRPLLTRDLERKETLRYLDSRARRFGYSVGRHGDLVVLSETGPDYRYTGSLVLRSGEARPTVIEVPSRREDQSLASFGWNAFEKLEGRAMILSGSHRLANPDGSSELTRGDQVRQTFNLFHQAVLGSEREAAWNVLQLHGFLPREGEPWPEADVLIAPSVEHRPACGALRTWLEENGIATAWASPEDPASAPYQLGYNAQAGYLDGLAQAGFAAVWLSPRLCDSFEIREEDPASTLQMRALGIPVRRVSLLEEALLPVASSPGDLAGLKERIRAYRESRNVAVLQQVRDWPGLEVECLVDPDTLQPALVFTRRGERVLGAHLHPSGTDHVATDLQSFRDGRTAWWEPVPKEGTP